MYWTNIELNGSRWTNIELTGSLEPDIETVDHGPHILRSVEEIESVRLVMNEEGSEPAQICRHCHASMDPDTEGRTDGENGDPWWCDGNPDGDENNSPHEAQHNPIAWANSARITIDEDDNAVHLALSVGDPRGAFVFTVRRTPDGDLIMHTPYPGESMPHLKLTELHPGTYKIG